MKKKSKKRNQKNIFENLKKWYMSLTEKDKTKYSIFLIGVLLIFVLILLVVRNIHIDSINAKAVPGIKLLGGKIVEVELNQKYEEYGVEAKDYFNNDLSKKVKIKGEVDTTKEGSYLLYYTVENSKNVKSKELLRIVKVIDADMIKADVLDEEGKLTSKSVTKLEEVITEVVLEHKKELGVYGSDACKMTDYLSPFVNNQYAATNQPDREIMRPLIKDVIYKKLGIK